MTSLSRPVCSLNLAQVAAVLAWLAPAAPGHADSPATFTSLQSIADLVPEGVKIQNGDQWDLAAIAQASAAVSAAKTHPAVFQITFGRYKPNTSHGCAYCVTGPDGTVDIHGTTIESRLWVYLPANQADALSKCQPGSTITVSGTISRSDIHVYGTRCFLSFIIEKAIVLGGGQDGVSGSPPPPGNPVPAPAIAPPPPSPVRLTEDQARAVVLIKGDNGEGTGFLVKMPAGPAVITNIHVISNNPNLQITTSSGMPITILSYQGATNRDLAMISIKNGDYKYLDLATDVSGIVQPGDEVITPGNSEGGEVVLNTDGKVLGIGPDRIEFDNPIYHGNSGGPVFHVKSGRVIGVVTEAMEVKNTDALDKASFANRNSAIVHTMRYFGFRLDNVPGWETYDWRQFQNETAFLDQFDQRSKCLDSYLNAPDDNKPEDTVWQQDDRIVKANRDYFDQTNGADASQRLDALRLMWGAISDIADTGMATIQNANNFYSYDQQRARDEMAYRKALKVELDQVNNDVTRLGGLPRTNN